MVCTSEVLKLGPKPSNDAAWTCVGSLSLSSFTIARQTMLKLNGWSSVYLMSHDSVDFPSSDLGTDVPIFRDLPWAGCIFSFPERRTLSTERLKWSEAKSTQNCFLQTSMGDLKTWDPTRHGGTSTLGYDVWSLFREIPSSTPLF